jgi:2-polyprenyl-6-methoxyphenol hydroxylase-like FAD-dependent oxidoreductase
VSLPEGAIFLLLREALALLLCLLVGLLLLARFALDALTFESPAYRSIVKLEPVRPQGPTPERGQISEPKHTLREMGKGQSPYPFMLALAQDVHERFLLEKLQQLGVTPEWRTELRTVSQDDSAVHAQLRNQHGAVETATFSFLVGCDGAHSDSSRA